MYSEQKNKIKRLKKDRQTAKNIRRMAKGQCLKKIEYPITDHAAVRYLERIKGIDIKKEIFESLNIEALAKSNLENVNVNGVKLVFKSNTLITIKGIEK